MDITNHEVINEPDWIRYENLAAGELFRFANSSGPPAHTDFIKVKHHWDFEPAKDEFVYYTNPETGMIFRTEEETVPSVVRIKHKLNVYGKELR